MAGFPTGDVATIDPDGFMNITDRSKDVIKSGGEWISSIEVENVAVSHPQVAEAACIACSHPKWTERPLVVVVRRPGATLTRDELLAFYQGKVAKWWIPDDVVFADELPHTATGKLQKVRLREMYREYVLPTVARGCSEVCRRRLERQRVLLGPARLTYWTECLLGIMSPCARWGFRFFVTAVG